MKQFNRIYLIVLDGVGVGALPDAGIYGDKGSNTLGHIYKCFKGSMFSGFPIKPGITESVKFCLPNLEGLGLLDILNIKSNKKEKTLNSLYGKMKEVSPGKDTVTGHWEMMGLHLNKPFPTYKHAFPNSIIKKFESKIGIKIIGNKVASGTEIIKELGELHIKTGQPIVYTSADSVFQIAAHKKVIPLRKLYDMCKIARSILKGKHKVMRVIARPFIGNNSRNFKRTSERQDFALKPYKKTVLDILSLNNKKVYGLGKIGDVFSGYGLTKINHTQSNKDTINEILRNIKNRKTYDLVFANLGDFDTLYGHRNDVSGFGSALKYFDKKLSLIMTNLKDNDLLIITADHGCDPKTSSTDHSREYVPLIVYSKKFQSSFNLGIRSSFSDVGKTILNLFGIPSKNIKGESFKDEIDKFV